MAATRGTRAFQYSADLQDLYDEWQRREEEQKLASRCRSLSPSQATTMSRSASGASHPSTAFDNDGISNDGHPKPRAKRNGPLTGVRKAKANFMRKLRACEYCRKHRVSCTHYDKPRYSRGYEANRTRGLQAPVVATSSLYPPSGGARPLQHVPQRPPTHVRPHRAETDDDLLGVFANPANSDFHIPATAYGAAEQEPDILSQLTFAAPGFPHTPVNPRPTFMSIGAASSPTHWQSLPFITGSGSFYTAPTEVGSSSLHLVGRQVSEELDEWECRWGYESSETQSVLSWVGDGRLPCLEHCYGLRGLRQHYVTNHQWFDDAKQHFMWRCKGCRFLDTNREERCPNGMYTGSECGSNEGSEWEKVCYAWVSRPEVGASAPPSIYLPNREAGFQTAFSPSKPAMDNPPNGYSGSENIARLGLDRPPPGRESNGYVGSTSVDLGILDSWPSVPELPGAEVAKHSARNAFQWL